MTDCSWSEATLYFDQNLERADVHSSATGRAAVFSARAPGKEGPNEDAAALIPFDATSGVLIVADGMGGAASGQHAAALTIEALRSALREGARQDAMLRTAILNGLEAANHDVQSLAVGAATTVALVEVQEDLIRPYHVGDSMILVVGQRGKVKLLTTSHSPVGFAVEAGFLDKTEAMYHEDRHLVSNVVGSPEMKIEIGPVVRLAERDTVLLASDGLSDNLHLDEIVQRVRKGPLENVAEQLFADVIRRMTGAEPDQPSKPDDLTFVVYRRHPGAS